MFIVWIEISICIELYYCDVFAHKISWVFFVQQTLCKYHIVSDFCLILKSTIITGTHFYSWSCLWQSLAAISKHNHPSKALQTTSTHCWLPKSEVRRQGYLLGMLAWRLPVPGEWQWQMHYHWYGCHCRWRGWCCWCDHLAPGGITGIVSLLVSVTRRSILLATQTIAMLSSTCCLAKVKNEVLKTLEQMKKESVNKPKTFKQVKLQPL